MIDWRDATHLHSVSLSLPACLLYCAIRGLCRVRAPTPPLLLLSLVLLLLLPLPLALLSLLAPSALLGCSTCC